MKKIGILTVCVCVCAAVAARAQNVAVVDMDELVRLHPNMAADDKLREQTRKDIMEESQELQQKLESMKVDFERLRKESQDPALSDKARKTAEERVDKARDALIAADRTASEKLQARREQYSEMNSRMLKKIIGDLREVVGKYAAEKKIQLVLPAAQMVYSEKSLDITDAILKQMNIERPAKTMEAAPVIKEKREDAAQPAAAAPVKDAAPVTPK